MQAKDWVLREDERRMGEQRHWRIKKKLPEAPVAQHLARWEASLGDQETQTGSDVAAGARNLQDRDKRSRGHAWAGEGAHATRGTMNLLFWGYA